MEENVISDYEKEWHMYSQADWEVMLEGDPQRLRGIADYQRSNDYFRVWGGVDDWHDCLNDHFSFNSIYFENEQEPNVVWQLSYELISLFNGASELLCRNSRKLSIHGINLDGSSTDYHGNTFATGLLSLPGITPDSTEGDRKKAEAKRDEELKKAVPSFPGMALLILATENEDVYMILKYLDLDCSWSNYYKLMETVESHAKIKGLEVPNDKSERTRFTNTANNYSLAGFDSRHGFKQNIKANNTPSMTIEEAYKFVTELCKNYLVAAYPKIFNRK